MGHPAHFHLFKSIIIKLKSHGHKVSITCQKKDILVELLENAGMSFYSLLPEGRKDTTLGMLLGMIKRDFRAYDYIKKIKPDLLIGTSIENSHLTKLLRIPSININEDDASVVPLYAKLSYPWSSLVLSPSVCDNAKWNNKTIKYNGYHELIYLHPNHFSPDKSIVEKYFQINQRYYIIRLSKLKAHHDYGIKGVSYEIAEKLINVLSKNGQVYITSERNLEPQLEKYRININPLDMHHVLAFADLFIGDSQTMAAEAGVLGTPYIRFNDFVGKIGYLKELEEVYQLGFGVKTSDLNGLFSKVDELLCHPNIKNLFSKRRQRMLSEKIDVFSFMVWFFENYPESHKTMLDNPNFQKWSI